MEQNITINKMMKNIESIEELKSTKKVADELTRRVDEFNSFANIKCIKEELLPKMDWFSKHIDKLLDDNENVKECVR